MTRVYLPLQRLLLTGLLLLLPLTGWAKYSTPDQIAPLTPDYEQKIASIEILQLLRRNHYQSFALNNDASRQLLDEYLKALDGNRSYFLASDIEQLHARYSKRLDNALKSGDLEPAFTIYNLYQKRAEERLRYMLDLLDNQLESLNFESDATLETDRAEADWPASTQALDLLWRKRLKDDLLRLELSGKALTESRELLTKRYSNQLRRLSQVRSEDAFQVYINAFTQLFDPHTQYFSPRKAENFDINMSLSLEGIGAVLQSEDEYTKVVRLVPGGPAAKAGQLKPADRIVGVGQDKSGEIIDVIGWRLDEVVDLIRGPTASTVRLEVLPAGSSGTRVYNITRDTVKLEEQSAQKALLEYQRGERTYRIGVIEIPAFYIDFAAAQAGDPDYKSTTRDVRRLIKELQAEDIDGLVIDLRNNGGGSLQEANDLVGLFIPRGPTVQVRNGRGDVNVQQDPDPNLVYGGPVTVLVNRLSASASEIFAGALQDYGRALIIGSQTFGKGTVQTVQPLQHGQLKFTLAKFYRVSGDSTQHKGVIPDLGYPSLIDNDEIGESALPQALAWDQIDPAEFSRYSHAKLPLRLLKRRHEERIKDNPDFAYLNAQKTLLDEYKDKTRVSLNRNTRQAERAQRESRQLEIENRLRQAKGQQQVASLDALEEEQEQERLAEHKPAADEDAGLVESGEILVDLIQEVSGQLQASHPARATLIAQP